MKKIKLLMLAAVAFTIASCTSNGEKASGNFTGSYLIMGNTVPGSITITKVSDTKVDMFLVCNSPSVTDYALGVDISVNGDVVTYSYSNSTSGYMDMISINGTLTGNTVTLDGVISLSGSNGVGVFTGTK